MKFICGTKVHRMEELMSVVIIGGHERMEGQYKEICKKYRCKVKV